MVRPMHFQQQGAASAAEDRPSSTTAVLGANLELNAAYEEAVQETEDMACY
jgi:hypothetical protein